MICCAFLSALAALGLYLKGRFAPAPRRNPLAWRPYDASRPVDAEEALLRPFSIEARMRSVRDASRGVAHLVRREHNAWIHVAAAGAVVILGAALRVSADDWRWLIAAIGMVLAAEGLNTALERLCDVVSPGRDQRVGVVKDVAAGAVLTLAAAAALIGAVTFAPYLFGGQGALFSICGPSR